jgi:hypothetical protein
MRQNDIGLLLAARRSQAMSIEPESLAPAEEIDEKSTLRAITWFSVGMAVATLGIFVGREMRQRYKFNHRTPYDFYSNSEERQASEFGMGI